MIEEKRYILIDFTQVTEEMVAACIQTSINTLRHVRFVNDNTDLVVLKWIGIKPPKLWQHFPVMSDEEMADILLNDIYE